MAAAEWSRRPGAPRPGAQPEEGGGGGESSWGPRPARAGGAHRGRRPAAPPPGRRAGRPGADVTPAPRLMSQVELVKSPWELERVRAAAAVCDAGWDAFVAGVREGVAEFELVAAVEAGLKRLGAEDNFMLIASGGEEVRGMTPPGPRRLRAGDMVRTELTPQVGGYFAQICRSAVLGTARDGQRRACALVPPRLGAGPGPAGAR